MESSQGSSLRTHLAKVGFVLGCTAAGAGWATMTPTQVELGPHDAAVEMTFDDQLTVDFGPLGSVMKHDILPVGLGARLTVGSIDAAPGVPPADSINNVIAQYGQAIADPALAAATIREDVADRIQADSRNMALFGIAAVGAGTLLSRSMSAQRRENLKASLAPSDSPYWQRWRAIGLVGATVVATTHGSVLPPADKDTSAVVAVFADTPLEGLRVEGALMRLVVETAAPRILDYYTEIQDFYKTVKQNFQDTFDRQYVADTIPDGSDIVLIQHISDNHCNIGMNRVHGAVADRFGVDITLNTGDLAMSGTEAESFCVSSEAAAINNPKVFVRGNHDSEDTEDQASDNGMTVIDDAETREIQGLIIMGMGDPRRSVFGREIYYTGEETIEDQAELIEEAACDADISPDIILTHDPSVARPAMIAGCASASFSGHTHNPSGPNLLNPDGGYQIVSGTSGGAAEGDITLGTLRATAHEAVYVYDRAEHRLLGYYRITANTDMSVTISDYIPVGTIGQPVPAEAGQAAPPNIEND